MNAAAILTRLEAAGLKVAAAGPDLVLTRPHGGAVILSEPQQTFLREHKAELLAHLTGRPPLITSVPFSRGPCGCGTSFYLANDGLRCWHCDAPAWAMPTKEDATASYPSGPCSTCGSTHFWRAQGRSWQCSECCEPPDGGLFDTFIGADLA